MFTMFKPSIKQHQHETLYKMECSPSMANHVEQKQATSTHTKKCFYRGVNPSDSVGEMKWGYQIMRLACSHKVQKEKRTFDLLLNDLYLLNIAKKRVFLELLQV